MVSARMVSCLEHRGPKPVGELSKHVALLMRRGASVHPTGGGAAGDTTASAHTAEVLTAALKHQYNGGIKRFIEAQVCSGNDGMMSPLSPHSKHLSSRLFSATSVHVARWAPLQSACVPCMGRCFASTVGGSGRATVAWAGPACSRHGATARTIAATGDNLRCAAAYIWTCACGRTRP